MDLRRCSRVDDQTGDADRKNLGVEMMFGVVQTAADQTVSATLSPDARSLLAVAGNYLDNALEQVLKVVAEAGA